LFLHKYTALDLSLEFKQTAFAGGDGLWFVLQGAAMQTRILADCAVDCVAVCFENGVIEAFCGFLADFVAPTACAFCS
jgi:hypothetical protein